MFPVRGACFSGSRIMSFVWRLSGRWSDGGLSEGYGHDGPGVCLGDGQTDSHLKDMGMTGLASVCLGDGQTEAYLKDMGMAGLASAWAMARRKPI